MSLATMHKEDVKAAIRKKYGTIKRFVDENELPATSVSDMFRGRTSKRVADAIEAVLSEQSAVSTKMDRSSRSQRSHRLNSGAR